jgi:VIT1/CCC1 family predicted Fe2+/Mn2+ transporter
MAVGNYLAAKTRIEYIEKARRREEWEIDNLVEQEKQEIRDIYAKKGFKEEILEEIVRIITSRRKVWVDTMMREELGLIEGRTRPIDTAITTFVAFNLVGLIPLLPFVVMFVAGLAIIASFDAFTYSIILTGAAFFLIGGVKGRMVQKPLIRSGLSTLVIGGIAASVAFVVGYILNLVV